MRSPIKDWGALTPDEKRLFARQMEIFAGFAEQTDYEVGRLVQTLEDMGGMDNTLFFYVAGDNGTSAEGGMNGVYNELTYFNGVPETIDDEKTFGAEPGGGLRAIASGVRVVSLPSGAVLAAPAQAKSTI